MPNLADLTDYAPVPANIPKVYITGNSDPMGNATGFDAPAVDATTQPSVVDRVTNRLLGLNGEERYQLWPEKVVRSALTTIPEGMAGKIPQWEVDPETGDVHTSQEMIGRAMDMASLAGTGGLAGATDATLGATPFLRPALKYKDRLYKGKEGQGHTDVIPDALYEDFQKKAMSGEDIADYNFGFHNDKGQFLDREKALEYGINTGLIDPHAGKFGALTSTMMADSSKPGVAIEAMAKTAEPFYSALEYNVKNINQDKMTGDAWLGTLSNKPGVKPEELDWTGLKSFLEENKGKPVTKGQIEQHLAENKIEVGETVKGKTVDENSKEFNSLVENIMKNEKPAGGLSAAQDLAYDRLGGQKAKYSQYQLPGGSNYREKLLTLPAEKQYTVSSAGGAAKDYHEPKTYKNIDEAKAEIDRRYAASPNSFHNIMDHNPGYRSSHWDEPNILAHIRMNDRIIDGKKSLHLEEIQSDWHQAGRKEGYKGQARQLTDAENKELLDLRKRAAATGLSEAEHARKFELGDIQDKAKNETGVPDAPFKKNWHELALKKAIREAAENGYDRLSWTAGEHHPTNPKNLSQTGPEADAADKGMQGFYNNILPKSVEKLTGQKVKQGVLPHHNYNVVEAPNGRFAVVDPEGNLNYFANKERAEAFRDKKAQENGKNKIHYIDIPQSLRDTAVGKGFPLFSSTHMFIPVDHEPEFKK